MLFSVLELKWTHMWRYEFHPPDLISVATLPCESWNSGILSKNQFKLHQFIIPVPSSTCTRVMCLIFAYLRFLLISNACTKQRFMTSMTYENANLKPASNLLRTSFEPASVMEFVFVWFEQDFYRCCGSAVWFHVCVRWRTLWTHVRKWMFIYMIHQNILLNCSCDLMHLNGCFVVNIKNWICVHMHFRCFKFHKVL